ncbi:MAG: hypothetical protein HY201_02390 [Nitrospirae bacterium]|nr:hypothetical protein [Candidatus Troglogloeales bacterium]MBI3598293.1 hypothetical protein [Candidatus Troglogloeales bacterium]
MGIRRSDGGWGIDFGKDFLSAVVDTRSALLALSTAGTADTTTASNALGYLLESQNTDGGWGAARGQPSELFYTALVSSALQQFPQTVSLATAMSKAKSYLTSQQQADGSFGDLFETALAYTALVPIVTDATVLGNAINHLTSAQFQNGS